MKKDCLHCRFMVAVMNDDGRYDYPEPRYYCKAKSGLACVELEGACGLWRATSDLSERNDVGKP